MENEKSMYKGKFVQVRELEKEGQLWEKVYLCGGLSIYPIQENGNILLVQEYRPHETPQVRLKPVTGIYENDYSFEENVQREMQEEIGFKAQSITKILEVKSSGTINNTHYFALAKGLIPSKIPNPDGEESIQKIISLSLEDIYKKILLGEIRVNNSFLGLFKLLEPHVTF